MPGAGWCIAMLPIRPEPDPAASGVRLTADEHSSPLRRIDVVKRRFDCQNLSTERWGELTPTRVGRPVGLTFSGLGSSRSTPFAWIRLRRTNKFARGP